MRQQFLLKNKAPFTIIFLTFSRSVALRGRASIDGMMIAIDPVINLMKQLHYINKNASIDGVVIAIDPVIG